MTCSSGDKPTITYKFGSGNNRVYESDFSPVEIITKTAPIETTDNYNPEGYQISFASPQGQFGNTAITVVDYQISNLFFSTFDSDNGYYLTFIPCGLTHNAIANPCSDSQRKVSGCRTNVFRMTNGQVTVNPNVKCPSPNGSKCAIQILHNGQLLFQDQGDCPLNYSVQCGKCPEGTCECPSPNYPGYCCLNCASTAASIRSITNELRAKNG